MSTILTTNLNHLIWCVVLLRSLSKSGYKITVYFFNCNTKRLGILSISEKAWVCNSFQLLLRTLVRRALNIFDVRNSLIEKSHSYVLYLSGIIFFSSFKCTKHQDSAYCGLDEPLLNTLFWVHVLYFKKQLIPPPCCLSFYTEYNIHERAQINSPGEQRPPRTEQLLSASPTHPPRACASNLLWGHRSRERGSNGTITSLGFPVSLLTLSVCDPHRDVVPVGNWPVNSLMHVMEATQCLPYGAVSLAWLHCVQTVS